MPDAGGAVWGPIWIGAVLAALITAAVTVSNWRASQRAQRQAEAERRRDRIIDIQKALRAEIKVHVHQLRRTGLEAHRDAMVARILAPAPRRSVWRPRGERQSGFMPFVTRDAHDTVYRALLADIHLLPTETVEPVVFYYQLSGAIAAMAEDLRSDAVRKLEADRRATMYRHYIDMKIVALQLGEDAIAQLDIHIAATEALNNPAPDPSGPATGFWGRARARLSAGG